MRFLIAVLLCAYLTATVIARCPEDWPVACERRLDDFGCSKKDAKKECRKKDGYVAGDYCVMSASFDDGVVIPEGCYGRRR